jgi:hypothetical protein
MRKSVSILLAFCIFTGLFSILTGCLGKDPFKKGSISEAAIKAGKDTKIGNSAKTGWEFLIPDGVMEDGTAITVKVLSAENANKTFFGVKDAQTGYVYLNCISNNY